MRERDVRRGVEYVAEVELDGIEDKGPRCFAPGRAEIDINRCRVKAGGDQLSLRWIGGVNGGCELRDQMRHGRDRSDKLAPVEADRIDIDLPGRGLEGGNEALDFDAFEQR